MAKNIKIYGIERSGTNFLEVLLKKNANVQVFTNTFGWKHGKIVPTEQWLSNPHTKKGINIGKAKQVKELYFVCLIKNPYTWQQSIERWKKDKDYDFRAEYKRYNELYLHYWNCVQNPPKGYKKGVICRYEDLLTKPKRKIISIFNRFDIPYYDDFYIPDKVYLSKNWKPDRKDFYLNPANSGANIEAINRILDRKIFKLYHYKRL